MFHVAETDGPAYVTGPEIQIQDNVAGHDPQKSGWLYQLYKPDRPTRPSPPASGTRMRIVLAPKGQKSAVYMNGQKYYEFEKGSDDWDAKVKQEQVQGHGGIRQADQRPHLPAEPRRRGRVPQHQDPHARRQRLGREVNQPRRREEHEGNTKRKTEAHVSWASFFLRLFFAAFYVAFAPSHEASRYSAEYEADAVGRGAEVDLHAGEGAGGVDVHNQGDAGGVVHEIGGGIRFAVDEVEAVDVVLGDAHADFERVFRLAGGELQASGGGRRELERLLRMLRRPGPAGGRAEAAQGVAERTRVARRPTGRNPSRWSSSVRRFPPP